MQIFIKVIVSLFVIITATAIGKKLPSAAGLIAVMPLTGALVLAWVYLDNSGEPQIMQNFTKGALWGIMPTLFFYVVAFLCFKKHLSLPIALTASFGAWLAAAIVHQWILK